MRIYRCRFLVAPVVTASVPAYFKVGKLFFFIKASSGSHLSEANIITESNGNLNRDQNKR